MTTNRTKYYYNISIWGGFYRRIKDGLPEEYNHKTYEWEKTEDAVEAFFKPGASDYTLFTLGQFVQKYYNAFNDSKTTDEFLKNPVFSEMCSALGFLDDDYNEIIDKLMKDYPRFFNDSEQLKKYINDIDDCHILGTAILFQWRNLTHWTYSYSILNNEEMPDAREWFITIFSRLADINNQMIREGKFTGWRYVDK